MQRRGRRRKVAHTSRALHNASQQGRGWNRSGRRPRRRNRRRQWWKRNGRRKKRIRSEGDLRKKNVPNRYRNTVLSVS
jgi:hypothetical protein